MNTNKSDGKTVKREPESRETQHINVSVQRFNALKAQRDELLVAAKRFRVQLAIACKVGGELAKADDNLVAAIAKAEGE